MERQAKNRECSRSLRALLMIVVPVLLAGCAQESPAYVVEPNRAVTPTSYEQPAAGYTVVVHRGDSLGAIAERCDTSVATIANMNELDIAKPIYPGQVLRVPSAPRNDAIVDRREASVTRSDDGSDMVRPTPRPHRAIAVNYEPGAAPEPRPDRAVLPPEDTTAKHDDQQSWLSSWWNKPSDDTQDDAAPAHFIWPVKGAVIESFGRTGHGERNDGINIAAEEGAPIRAAAAGTVTYAGNELKGYGNLVLIRHSNGYVTAYAHAQSIRVARGDIVKRGQVIGTAGATGDVDRPQLHFEIRKGVQPVDPSRFLVADRAS